MTEIKWNLILFTSLMKGYFYTLIKIDSSFLKVCIRGNAHPHKSFKLILYNSFYSIKIFGKYM